MMRPIKEIKESVASWWAQASGMPKRKVLIGTGTPDPKSNRPRKPYAQLTFTMPSITVGQDERVEGETVAGAATEKLIGHRRAIVSVQVMGEDASDYIESARLSWPRQRFLDLAREEGISIVDIGPTMNLSQLLDTSYEERAQAELRVGYVHEIVDTGVGTIEDAVAAGELTGGSIGSVELTADTTAS